MRIPSFALASATVVLACASCANFKSQDGDDAQVDAAVPTVEHASGDEPSEPTRGETKPPPPAIIDDGLRMPDMLSLPSERELRRASPEVDAESPEGVTARPPAEQPAPPAAADGD